MICYTGRSPKANSGYAENEVGPERFVTFLYSPELKNVILLCAKGTTIEAYRTDENASEDYIQRGEKRIISKEKFKKTIEECLKLSKLKFSTIQSFYKLF